ncbi:MAG: ABC transporter permease [Actinomycetota bacterium]|nr:ABC transporter permease [Actinomycetota bacterium]
MLRSLSESRILWARNTHKLLRVPMLLFFSLFQPLLFLVLFSQVFSRLAQLPGFAYDSYLQFLVPSVVALTALNSAFQSGMGMVNDIDDGMLDKFLIAPVRRSSILVGKVLADASRITAQALVVLAVAFLMGTRFFTGWAGLAVIVVLAALFGVAWAGLSNVVALRTRNAELTMLIGILITFPVLFLSTAFMPAALLPEWLETVATYNPITYLVDALRALVNTGWDWSAIGQALAVIASLAVLTMTAATRAFRRAIG